ncbi:hypothetical protein ABK040_011144 [Willaertia magna]
MYCNISGDIPQQPVVSKKSGHLFEKNLILKYLEQYNNKCPVTGQDLSPEDLIDVISKKSSTPKPSTTNHISIPQLLSSLQNEYEAICLETFTLQQNLQQTKKDLSNSLYQHDAACRVIARIMKERDNLKENLKKNIESTNKEEEDAEMNSAELSEDILQKIGATAEILSTNRKQRIISPQLRNIESMKQLKNLKNLNLGKDILSFDLFGNLGISCGSNGNISLFENTNLEMKRIGELKSGSIVNDVVFHNTPEFALSYSNQSGMGNVVQIWSLRDMENLANMVKLHQDEISGIALHPSGYYFITCGRDEKVNFCDIEMASILANTKTVSSGSMYTCTQFHPDGLLFGTGSSNDNNHSIKIWDVKTFAIATQLDGHTNEITSLSFSENGYYLASSSKDGTVGVWDLRKLKRLHTFEYQTPVVSATFDYSGVYLGVACADGRVKCYQSKVWNELFEHQISTTGSLSKLKFGPNANFIAVSALDGVLRSFE